MDAYYLCYKCVRESFLSFEIKTKGLESVCSYCEKSAPSFPLRDVAERVKIAFSDHYVRTSDSDSDFDKFDGQPVVSAIMDAALIEEDVAEDIQEILRDESYDFEKSTFGEECEFADTSRYEPKNPDDSQWHGEWSRFEKVLKREARFFSKEAARILESVFAGVDNMSSREGHPTIIDAGPGTSLTSLFRARVFESKDELSKALCRPELELGSPPSFRANAGRMNAHGISVFYGATGTDTAIGEVRPPVGSHVAVARFVISRPLRLLDLPSLRAVEVKGSIFDPKYIRELERGSFLRTLTDHMTRAVMPTDQAFDYLPTQAVADYLASDSKLRVNGIVFPSVQVTGQGHNIVLFYNASRVAKLTFPEGTTIEANTGYMTEDGWEDDYTVYEERPPAKEPKGNVLNEDDPLGSMLLVRDLLANIDDDERPATLEIDLADITVHKIQAASFTKVSFKVFRHSVVKTSPPY